MLPAWSERCGKGNVTAVLLFVGLNHRGQDVKASPLHKRHDKPCMAGKKLKVRLFIALQQSPYLFEMGGSDGGPATPPIMLAIPFPCTSRSGERRVSCSIASRRLPGHIRHKRASHPEAGVYEAVRRVLSAATGGPRVPRRVYPGAAANRTPFAGPTLPCATVTWRAVVTLVPAILHPFQHIAQGGIQPKFIRRILSRR